MVMKVYCPKDNYKLSKIVFAAKIYRKAVEHVDIAFDHRHKSFQEAYPCCSMPALQLDASTFVFGTNSILEALSDTSATPFEQAEIWQWLELVEKELDISVGVLIAKTGKVSALTEEAVERAHTLLAGVLRSIDEWLRTRTFLVGQRMTIADISVFMSLQAVEDAIRGELKKWPNVARWNEQMRAAELQ